MEITVLTRAPYCGHVCLFAR